MFDYPSVSASVSINIDSDDLGSSQSTFERSLEFETEDLHTDCSSNVSNRDNYVYEQSTMSISDDVRSESVETYIAAMDTNDLESSQSTQESTIESPAMSHSEQIDIELGRLHRLMEELDTKPRNKRVRNRRSQRNNSNKRHRKPSVVRRHRMDHFDKRSKDDLRRDLEVSMMTLRGLQDEVRALESGAASCFPWENPTTIASGLRVPNPFSGYLILQVVRESRGTALTVTDEECLTAVSDMASSEGILPCPEGAATLAALRKLLEDQLVLPSERIVLLNTGSGFKYLDVL